MSMKRFTTKRVRQKKNSHFSFANERREQTRLCGFTLVETMIAVTILTFAVAGPLFTASRAIIAAQISRDQLIASYLAQEGIEHVRAMRDNEYLAAYRQGGANISSTAWNNFLNNESQDVSAITQCRSPKICTLDPVQSSSIPLTTCPDNICTAPLYLVNNGTTNMYTQQNTLGGTVTPFIRTVQAIDVSPNDERIVSTVSWSFHNLPYSVTVTDHLTPWQ